MFAAPTEYLAKLHDSGKAARVAGTVAGVNVNDEDEISAVGKAQGRNKAKAKPAKGDK